MSCADIVNLLRLNPLLFTSSSEIQVARFIAVAIVQGDVVQVLTLISVLAALETEGEVAEILGRILEAEGDLVETLGLTLPFFNIFLYLKGQYVFESNHDRAILSL